MNWHTRFGAMFMGLAVTAGAFAHAMLERASPAVGSSVRVAPGRLELWFTEPLEPAFSTLKVVDAGGHQVDGRDTAVDKGNGRHIVVSLPPLTTGRYRVIWRAVSVDTHATEGDFTFAIFP